jgi:hypothetical protein
MKKFLKQRKLVLVLISTIFLCLFVFNTNPKELSAPYLLVPPLLIFLILALLSSAALSALTALPAKKRKLVSGVIAGGPLVMLLLASLGQLTLKDTVLSLLFVAGLAAYASRAAPGIQSSS